VLKKQLATRPQLAGQLANTKQRCKQVMGYELTSSRCYASFWLTPKIQQKIEK